MSRRLPNAALGRLLAETGWGQQQFATAVNRVGTESGMPLRYDDSAVNHWLNGTIPREVVRPLILEALSRKLRHPITHADAGFPSPHLEHPAA